MKWLKFIPEVIAAFAVGIPLIRVLVEQFETPGFGSEKQRAVLDALILALKGFGFRESVVNLIVSAAEGIIDAFVWLKNAIGEFKHKGEEPAEA